MTQPVINPGAPPLPAPIRSSTLRLAPITDSAVAETIRQIRREHAQQVGIKASTAGGGGGQVFFAWQRRQLEAAGYIGWKKSSGFEFGGEVTWDLRPTPAAPGVPK